MGRDHKKELTLQKNFVRESNTISFIFKLQKISHHFFLLAHCLKITQNVSFEFSILEFSAIFYPIKVDSSGNTV